MTFDGLCFTDPSTEDGASQTALTRFILCLKYLNSLNYICKDSDNQGILVKFAPKIMIVYESSIDQWKSA